MSCGNVDLQEDFIEMVGRHKKSNKAEMKKLIKKYWEENPEVSAYSKNNSISSIFNQRYRDVIREYNRITSFHDRIPVVVITGDATDDIRLECEQLGVWLFLTKPVELNQLYEVRCTYVAEYGQVADSA